MSFCSASPGRSLSLFCRNITLLHTSPEEVIGDYTNA